MILVAVRAARVDGPWRQQYEKCGGVGNTGHIQWDSINLNAVEALLSPVRCGTKTNENFQSRCQHRSCSRQVALDEFLSKYRQREWLHVRRGAASVIGEICRM